MSNGLAQNIIKPHEIKGKMWQENQIPDREHSPEKYCYKSDELWINILLWNQQSSEEIALVKQIESKDTGCLDMMWKMTEGGELWAHIGQERSVLPETKPPLEGVQRNTNAAGKWQEVQDWENWEH